MSSLTRGGQLGVYFVADEGADAPAKPVETERVSMITGTTPPAPDVQTPGAPPVSRTPQGSLDMTGMALGLAGITAIYFLMSK